MGRVTRYKKVKACDPYSKENRAKGGVSMAGVGVWGLGELGRKPKKRSLKAQKMVANKLKYRKEGGGGKAPANGGGGFDMPPEDEDDFDVATMVVQKRKRPPTLEDLPAPAPGADAKAQRQAEREERKINKMLKLDAASQEARALKAATAAPMVTSRQAGESKNAFRKRVKSETRQMINDSKQVYRNPEKKQRKKDFLKNKKLKKKGLAPASASRTKEEHDMIESDEDDLVTAELDFQARTAEVPRFGEQAERPPEFKQLPRKASAKATPGSTAGGKGKRKQLDDEGVRAEQAAMEILRKKVQAQYAIVRQKRRGEFHL
jgi:hypothetical protein